MIKSIKTVVGLMAIFAVSFNIAYAETKLAVMNYQAVLFNSVAAEDATLQLRSSLADAQGKLKDIQLSLESRQNRLKTDAEILTQEETLKFQQEIQAMLADQAQLSGQMQQAQQQSRNDFIKNYQPVIRELVAAYVEEQGYSLVVDSQAVLWNANTPDITETIQGQFDVLFATQKNSAE